MGSLRKKLQNVFGYEDYESTLQEKACEVIYREKRDALICALSNSEKSLCIQLPSATIKSKFAVVITPTRALAKSHVNYLKSKNIPAFYLNACSSTKAKSYVKTEMIKENPNIKLLYMTYQQILNSHVQFKLFQAKQNVFKFIFNEADCLSPLASKFKNPYVKLGLLKKKFSGIPIVAFISTAAEEIREHIIQILQLQSPIILHKEEFVRQELNESRKNLQFSSPIISYNAVAYIDSGSGESIKFIDKESGLGIGTCKGPKRFKITAAKVLKKVNEIMSNDRDDNDERLFKLNKFTEEQHLVEECLPCHNKKVNAEKILNKIKMILSESEDFDVICLSDDNESIILFSD